MQLKNRLLVKNCIEGLNDELEQLSPLFYKELFHLDIHLETVFSGDVAFLNRKFLNMMATFKNVKHLENISESVAKMGERHILKYRAEIKHFPTLKQALLTVLQERLKTAYTEELNIAWHAVFDEVSAIMQQAMAKVDSSKIAVLKQEDSLNDTQLLADIGGEAVIFAVHESLYEVLFNEPWLEDFFFGKSKQALIKKQTEFMVAAFNGPNNYTGDTPAFVHMHMFITDEMINVREKILRNAIKKQGLSDAIADRWLKVDSSFRPAIVKKSLDECVMKCKGQQPVTAEKPLGYRVKY